MTSFCVSELEAIKNLPGYQAILRTILKSQIKQLVEQLSAYAGEEAILLSASLDDGTLSHVGSKSGEVFLDTHCQVREQFLGFCMRTCKGNAEIENSSRGQTEVHVTSVEESIPTHSKEEQGQLKHEQDLNQDGLSFDIVMDQCREKMQQFSEFDTSIASTFDSDKGVGNEDNQDILGEDSDETLMVIKQEPDSDGYEDDASEDMPDESLGDVEPSAVAVCKNGKNSWVDPDAEEDVPKKRFKSASAEDVGKLRTQNTEKGATDKQTKWAVKIFQEWMLDMGLATNEFESFAVADLDVLLQRFYASVRTKDGKEYSKQALIGMRAALNRHLTTPPFSRTLNLMNDREFTTSNQVFSGLVKDLKREGKNICQHKEPISQEDMKKLYDNGYFATDNPKTLQNKVLFDIISQFGRKITGQDGLRTLKRDSFITKVDTSGRKYICLADNVVDKTQHDSRERHKEPRMYESMSESCPVKSFEKYVSKLNPTCPELFQRPLEKVTEATPIWYAHKPIGVNMLSSFMSRLSKEANLSQKYTNHCILVTNTLHVQQIWPYLVYAETEVEQPNLDETKTKKIAVTKKKSFKCPWCGKNYSSAGKMRFHQKRDHEGITFPKFTCSYCQKEFVSAGNISRHVNSIHKKEKRFTCDICNEGFLTRWEVQRHMDQRHNAPRFKCSGCGKRFKLKSYLTRHEATCATSTLPTKAVPVECEICNKIFKSEKYKKEHIKFSHSESPSSFVCVQCGDAFTRKYALMRHVAKAHHGIHK